MIAAGTLLLVALAVFAEWHLRRDRHAEIDGASWCLTHGDVWIDGESTCGWGHLTWDGDDCVEAPLFHGAALGGGQ